MKRAYANLGTAVIALAVKDFKRDINWLKKHPDPSKDSEKEKGKRREHISDADQVIRFFQSQLFDLYADTMDADYFINALLRYAAGVYAPSEQVLKAAAG